MSKLVECSHTGNKNCFNYCPHTATHEENDTCSCAKCDKVGVDVKCVDTKYYLPFKECIVIQTNFSDGSSPNVIREGKEFSWYGGEWWKVKHNNSETIVEEEHGVECDLDDGSMGTMSVIAISFMR